RADTLSSDVRALLTQRKDIVVGYDGPWITVFSNYECGYCARFDSTLQQLADAGRFRVAYRHVAFRNSPSSYLKHRLVECVDAGGVRIDDVHREAFSLRSTPVVSVGEVVRRFVSGSNASDIEACAEGVGDLSTVVDQRFAADSVAVAAAGIASTPT